MTLLDVALLVVRVAVGGIYIAHGARKLGWRSPNGFAGFAGSIRRRGYRMPMLWAVAAVAAEVGGGLLAVVGLLTPVAGALLLAQSLTIIALVWPRGFWVEEMGVEYPLHLGVAALAVLLAGPGALSLDAALGLRFDPVVPLALAACAAIGAVAGLATRRPVPEA